MTNDNTMQCSNAPDIDVNKELADDLRANYTVVIGKTTIWTSCGQIIRKQKDRKPISKPTR